MIETKIHTLPNLLRWRASPLLEAGVLVNHLKDKEKGDLEAYHPSEDNYQLGGGILDLLKIKWKGDLKANHQSE